MNPVPSHPLLWKKWLSFAITLTALAAVFALLSGCSKSAVPAKDEFIQQMFAGKNYLEKGEAQRAIEAFKKAAAVNAAHHDVQLNLANAYLLANEPENAVKHAQEALNIDPNSAAAFYVLGCAHLRSAQYQAAVQALQESIKRDQSVTAAYFQLGLAHQHLQQWDEAITNFQYATTSDPAHPAAFYNLSQALVRKGQTDEASEALEQHKVNTANLKNFSPTAAAFEKSKHTQARLPFSMEQPEMNGIKVAFVDATQDAFAGAGGAGQFQGPFGVIDVRHDGENDLFVCEGKDGFRLLLNSKGKFTAHGQRIPGIQGATYSKCLIGDLENDAQSDRGEDVIFLGPQGTHAFKVSTNGNVIDRSMFSRLAPVKATDGVLADLDFTGKLDLLALTGTNTVAIYRSIGNFYFKDISATSGIPASLTTAHNLSFDDWNNDDLIDLFVGRKDQPPAIFAKVRGGLLTETNPIANLPQSHVFALGDLNNDLRTDLVIKSQDKIECIFNGETERVSIPAGTNLISQLTLADYDNDGWLDICASGNELRLWRNLGRAGFKEMTEELGLSKSIGTVQYVRFADFDADGDSDLLAGVEGQGLRLFRNDGGNENHQLKLRLLGNRSNSSGLGIKVEISAGGLRLSRMVRELPIEIGVGKHQRIESVSTRWFDLSQEDSDVETQRDSQYVIAELILPTGSCPYLYAWDGEKFRFITDLLGAAPLGLPVAEGHYIESDPDEYVWIGNEDLFKPRGDDYVLQITEELREVLYLDEAKLVVVDHPPGTEIYPTDKLVPGKPFPPSELVTLHQPVSLAKAVRHDGADVTELLKHCDNQFVSPTQLRAPQFRGHAEPHSVTLDFGILDTKKPLVLALTGWLRFGGGMANIAASHRPDFPFPFPTMEVETAEGKWEKVDVVAGAPAGKTKRMMIDLAGKLPSGSRRLKLSASFEIHWDQAVLMERADSAATKITTLAPAKTDLHWRGYSVFEDLPWYMPLTPDYTNVRQDANWRITPAGWCTRYGEVNELISKSDNELALLNGGDELTLSFPLRQLPKKPDGYVRDFFVFTAGWDKDADFHVKHGTTVEPLPFHGMDDQLYGKQQRPVSNGDQWIQKYNTRWVGPLTPKIEAARAKMDNRSQPRQAN